MGKQLEFTKKEQDQLPKLIQAIGVILLKKMDNGVEAPTLSGTMEMPDSNREVVFSITAQSQ